MSENTQDDFAASSPIDQSEENERTQATDSAVSPTDEAPTTEEKTLAPANEEALPPEARGETNGGPLGCCLGVMIGLLLSGASLSFFLTLFSHAFSNLQGFYGLLGLLARILMGILALALAILFAIIGWRLGRRFFREYEPPLLKERGRPRRPREQRVRQRV